MTLSKPLSGYGYEVRRGQYAQIDLSYPDRTAPCKTYVIIGLSDVRAVGNIRVWYDFERDGFVVERQTIYSWNADEAYDCGWVECASISAPLPDDN